MRTKMGAVGDLKFNLGRFMARQHLSAFVLDRQYLIVDSPDPLHDLDGERCQALPDHDQSTIWIDPDVAARHRFQVILLAVSRAWQDRMRMAPSVD